MLEWLEDTPAKGWLTTNQSKILEAYGVEDKDKDKAKGKGKGKEREKEKEKEKAQEEQALEEKGKYKQLKKENLAMGT